VTIEDPNDVRGMLAVAFAERPTPVLDATTREERRRRATSGIHAILAKRRPMRQGLMQRIHWGETVAVMALAAGLALVVGRLWPSGSPQTPVSAFRAIDVSGRILCDRGDGKNWTSCDPAKVSGVVGLRTLERAAATVETNAGIRINLEASSTLVMTDATTSALASRVTLTDGSIDVKVPKLGPNRQFSVLTPSATITVHGTIFSVEVKRSANQPTRTCVRLREGEVSVLFEGSEVRLVAPAVWGCSASADAIAATSDVVIESNDSSKTSNANATTGRRPNLANLDRSTLAQETQLLQRALGAEQRKDLVGAEKSLKLLLNLYPKSVVAPEARAALERIGAKQSDKRHE